MVFIADIVSLTLFSAYLCILSLDILFCTKDKVFTKHNICFFLLKLLFQEKCCGQVVRNAGLLSRRLLNLGSGKFLSARQ